MLCSTGGTDRAQLTMSKVLLSLELPLHSPFFGRRRGKDDVPEPWSTGMSRVRAWCWGQLCHTLSCLGLSFQASWQCLCPQGHWSVALLPWLPLAFPKAGNKVNFKIHVW